MVKLVIAFGAPIKFDFSSIEDSSLLIKALLANPSIPKIYVEVDWPVTRSTTLKLFLLSSTFVELLLTLLTYAEWNP